MRKLADVLLTRQHFKYYVNFRNAHCSHAEYVRDNNLSEDIGEILHAAYMRTLSGEGFSDIIREMDGEIIKLRKAEETKPVKGRRHKARNDSEIRRLVNEIERMKRVRRILRKRVGKKSR